jgi:hypothetical protein
MYILNDYVLILHSPWFMFKSKNYHVLNYDKKIYILCALKIKIKRESSNEIMIKQTFFKYK